MTKNIISLNLSVSRLVLLKIAFDSVYLKAKIEQNLMLKTALFGHEFNKHKFECRLLTCIGKIFKTISKIDQIGHVPKYGKPNESE